MLTYKRYSYTVMQYIARSLYHVPSPVYLFADDTKVLCVIRNRDYYLALQNELNLLYNLQFPWLLGNRHLIRILKCKHLHLGLPHHFVSYHINSLVIDSVRSHKDLGIQFDDQLKFHEHTSEDSTKANRILGI